MLFLAQALRRLMMMFACFVLSTISLTSILHAQQTLTVGDTDIGGVVTSTKGPEAGVWVIAETTELPTRFARVVVTDDQGRYLVPDLPAASYSVWVRGYGLVDSAKVTAKPGQLVDHTAVPAPNETA